MQQFAARQHFQPSAGNFSPNLTDRDLSASLGPVAGTGGLNIQFFYAPTKISCRNPELNGRYEARLCVAKMPKGDRLTIATRFISEEQAMREFPREFAMFKQYDSVPTNGTPLHELPGVSQSQIAILVLHNLRSIEDVAECAEEIINGMGIDARQAYQVAKRWAKNRAESAPLIEQAERDAKIEQELAAIRARADAAERANIELSAQIKAMVAMSGQMPVAQPVMGQGGMVMVDRGDDLPDAKDLQSNMFEGGIVDGNDDLDEGPTVTVDDPLGVKSRKGR
jgi:hypothetical protein